MKPLPSLSLTGTAHSQDLDTDVHSFSTSPAQPLEEEGKVSDQEAAEQESDQKVSEEQTYWETIRGIDFHQVLLCLLCNIWVLYDFRRNSQP